MQKTPSHMSWCTLGADNKSLEDGLQSDNCSLQPFEMSKTTEVRGKLVNIFIIIKDKVMIQSTSGKCKQANSHKEQRWARTLRSVKKQTNCHLESEGIEKMDAYKKKEKKFSTRGIKVALACLFVWN